jgi:hypothetical protein
MVIQEACKGIAHHILFGGNFEIHAEKLLQA